MIYFDNAATTPVRREVLEKALPFLETAYGNASSVYSLGREAKKAVETARAEAAAVIGADVSEIFFTSGGTEADNWAIKGAAEALKDKGRHLITTAIEHHAVLHTFEYLEKNGYEATYLPVDKDGLVDPKELEAAIRPDTILISVMFANNEIGVLQPIAEIGEISRRRGVLFHTDAVQAVGHVPVNAPELKIDMLSLSGHKLYAPKGAGALYVRRGVKIAQFMHGGAQERKRRAGTENVAGVAALGEALRLASAEMELEAERARKLRDRITDGILNNIPHTFLNGHREKRLPGNINISFEYIEGESLLLLLDGKGIAASSGSACTSGSLDPSHVLLALGLPHEKAHGSLRISIGRFNTEEDADALLRELPPIVARLREMSPLWSDR
ncbi:MAG: cysteine desulfurase NifS [Clostridiales bacterium]|jgi:cysteine desulfurase|nr:cysteine desulfurase NifS [Clostridiales bacterium]